MSEIKKDPINPARVGVYNQAVTEMKDRDLREFNFQQVKLISKSIKSMFGPKGFSKLITPRGSKTSFVTQKGLEVSKALKKPLPVVKMLIELAETQEKNCGDGTKTVILLTELLWEKARQMINDGIHPQLIDHGFSLAIKKSLEILDETAIAIDSGNDNIVQKLFSNNLTNKFAPEIKQICLDFFQELLENRNSVLRNIDNFDFSDIYFRKTPGKGMTESTIINGVIINKEKPNWSMPTRFEDPRVILIQRSLDFFVPNNVTSTPEAQIKDPAKLKEFEQFREEYYKSLAENFSKQDINIILCQKKINEAFFDACANLGVIALDLVGEKELKTLSKMLNVGTISVLEDITENDIGHADFAEFRHMPHQDLFFLTCKNSPIVTFLLRGGTDHVLSELQEVLKSSLKVTLQSMQDKKVLPGGGALESEIARALKQYATMFENKLQIVISEFGNALENIPAFLVVNAGGEPLEIIPTLRGDHDQGYKYNGFDCNSNSVVDVLDAGILDGYRVRKHCLRTASDMARQLIRIDDLIIVYDNKLFKEIEEEGRPAKEAKRNEEIRQYFKKNDNKLFG